MCMESIIYACVLVPLSSRQGFFAVSKSGFRPGGTTSWDNGLLG